MAFSTNTNIYKISSHRCLNFSCFFLSFFFFFATFYFVIISNFTENFKSSTETALRRRPFAFGPACLRVLSGSAPSPPPPRSLPSFLSLSHALRYALKCKTARSGCLYFAANDLNTAKPHGGPAGSAPLRQGRRWTRRPPCAAASPPPAPGSPALFSVTLPSRTSRCRGPGWPLHWSFKPLSLPGAPSRPQDMTCRPCR